MVADSRQVALNHTAGLSLPQQVQMGLFSLFALLDTANSYKTLCQLIVRRRYKALWEGLGLAPPPDEDRAFYYAELDIMVWAEKFYGPDFMKFLRKNYEAPISCWPAEIRRRTDARRRVRGSGMVGPGVARQPAGGYVSENRQVPEGGSSGLCREWKASGQKARKRRKNERKILHECSHVH
jgi:hypothetical protein